MLSLRLNDLVTEVRSIDLGGWEFWEEFTRRADIATHVGYGPGSGKVIAKVSLVGLMPALQWIDTKTAELLARVPVADEDPLVIWAVNWSGDTRLQIQAIAFGLNVTYTLDLSQ